MPSSWARFTGVLSHYCGMKTTIDKAGRVVIPAALRAQAGFKYSSMKSAIDGRYTLPRSRLAKAKVVITDNRRHFTSLMRHGIRVLSTLEFADEALR